MTNTVVRLSILLLLFAVVAYGQRRGNREGYELWEENREERYEAPEEYREEDYRIHGDRSKRSVQPYLEKVNAASFLRNVAKLKSS